MSVGGPGVAGGGRGSDNGVDGWKSEFTYDVHTYRRCGLFPRMTSRDQYAHIGP